MKANWVLIPLFALILGCSREIDHDVITMEGEFTLYATSGEKETRTVLQQDGSIFWSPADCINVFYGDESGKFTSDNTEAVAFAEFTGSLGSITIDGQTEFYAAYPYSAATRFSSNTRSISLTLPSEQEAVEGTFADELFVSVAKSNEFTLHFQNVCGGVKFSLTRGDIRKVVFKGNNGEYLTGRLAIEFASDGKPYVADVTDGKTAVTLVAPGGEAFKAGSWYYLVLVPQILRQGYTIELYTDELVETISSSSSVTVRRSAWGVLKNLAPSTPVVQDAVDLGLSVMWATCNLGSTTPEGYGDFYAWGETEPKEEYEWETYKWCTESYVVTKYCHNPLDGFKGYTDKKTILDLEDDAAYVTLEGKWRMPTKEEFDELHEKCSWKWTTWNGIEGNLVTGPSGQAIFLPAAGYWDDPEPGLVGESGYYWTSSLEEMSSSSYAHAFRSRAMYSSLDLLFRFDGLSIRPVYAYKDVPVETVGLDKTSMEMIVEESIRLDATVSPENATNKAVSWLSSDSSVAVVSGTGVVTGVSAGSAVITASVTGEGKSASCTVTVKEISSMVVDLGLSVKWGAWNVGASKPEEYGNYYAWGETEAKTLFNDHTYLWYDTGEYGYYYLAKYNSDPSSGTVDNKVVLDPEDDAAHVRFGDKWRMPTEEEFEELANYCTWTSAELAGIKGTWVTSTVNGNRIFLPNGGSASPGLPTNPTTTGFYWSNARSENSEFARALVSSSAYARMEEYGRTAGFSIRPVYAEASSTVPVSGISLDKNELEVFLGEIATLSATIYPENASYRVVTWSSSDESVATVSPTGTVKGIYMGQATITATTVDGNHTATCLVTVKAKAAEPVPGAVDMGLSVKWASFNLGATRPEEYGHYYAWGETEPKQAYHWQNYKWGVSNSLTKYNTSRHFGEVDNLSQLEPEDDVVHVKLGGHWRMPTLDEFTELRTKCTWTWISNEEKAGFEVTSQTTGNTIFLPAAGGRKTDAYSNDPGEGRFGNYWTSSLYTSTPNQAYEFYFNSGYKYQSYDQRSWGFTIRPVYKE